MACKITWQETRFKRVYCHQFAAVANPGKCGPCLPCMCERQHLVIVTFVFCKPAAGLHRVFTQGDIFSVGHGYFRVCVYMYMVCVYTHTYTHWCMHACAHT
eukprot:scpid113515/ scgid19578/ 